MLNYRKIIFIATMLAFFFVSACFAIHGLLRFDLFKLFVSAGFAYIFAHEAYKVFMDDDNDPNLQA